MCIPSLLKRKNYMVCFSDKRASGDDNSGKNAIYKSIQAYQEAMFEL